MSVFYKFCRYRFHRFSFLLFVFLLIVVLVVGGGSAYSQLLAVSKWVNFQISMVSKETPTLLTENVRKTVLENHLTVLTKEVHTSPVVTVQVWYKVGSRNEEPGVNGIAHQLEHMMFRGTKNRPIQFGRLFSVLGSDSNAFTSYDQTAYYNTVEPDKLKALLALEADRMQNALIDTEKLAQEKRVVISELQGYENSPNYRLSRAVMRAAFPNHPYGSPVGGTKAEVEKFQVDQVRRYYHNFYTPDNAVLVMIGDFHTAPTLKAVEQTFGKILRGDRSQESGVRSQETGDRRQESGVRSQETGVRRQESGDRSRETGDRRQESGDRSRETGDRRQESGVRRQESGVRRQESGVRSQESGVRSQESGVRSQETGDRRQESGVRSQETGDRRQESGVRSQELGVRSQETGDRRQETGVGSRESGDRSEERIFHSSLITPHSSAVVLREPGAGGLLEAVYRLPDANHPDVAALNVMDYILTGGRNSRLYQALVESGLASDVTASAVNLRESGWYELSVTANPNQNLTKIDSVLRSAIANFAQKGVTAEEVKRAKAQLAAALILSNLDITSQATLLGSNETTVGDYRYTDRYLVSVRGVTAADVQRVANTYLKPEARTLGFFEPTQIQQKDMSGKANSAQVTEHFTSGTPVSDLDIDKYLPPVDLANASATTLTSPQQFTLSNGLRVLLLPDRSTPTVTLNGYIKAGAEFDNEKKSGIASIVADNLMNGTKTKDVFTIAKALEDRGASLTFKTYREGVQIQGNSLAVDLPVLVRTFADVVKNPTFPTKELELSRQKALTALNQELNDPSEVAKRTFVQFLYPKKHPLHTFPTQESLHLIKRQDVIDFKRKLYRPDTTVLTLVGDFAPTSVRSLLEAEFGNWKAHGQPPKLEYPAVSMPKTVVRVNPIIPGKTQAITYMGNIGINRKDPRFYAASVLNQILGGDTLSSRLGAEVRDRQGLTYGIYSNFLAGKNSGTFLIEMQTSPEDTPKAIASTRELLKQIHQQGVTALEVETAKRTLLSNYTISLAKPEELASRILMNEVYALSEEELRSFREKIQAVTQAQVNQAARELLHPDKIVVVTAGPGV